MMDRLNNLQRREWYEEYFSAVDVPQIERDKRVQLAEDIDDAYDGLFDLIAVMTVMNQEMDREYLTGYLQTRIADVGNGSDYLNEYALVTARDVVNTTLDHEGEEWYTSEDRKLLLSAGDAQTIGNYEQFEKALAQGKTHKTWKSELLKTTRKDHSEMHGKTIPIKEMFVFSDCEMLFPRDVVNGTAKQVSNCKCSLSYSKMTDQEYADYKEQHMDYRKELDYENEIIRTPQLANSTETQTIKAFGLKNSPVNLYISEKVNIKPKKLHAIESYIAEAKENIGVDGENVPQIVLISDTELGKTGGRYEAKSNTLFIKSLIDEKEQKHLIFHELTHWKDVQEYISKGNVISSDEEFIEMFSAISKNKLDKLGITYDNIFANTKSNYAESMYAGGRFDESYTEYRVAKMLREVEE